MSSNTNGSSPTRIDYTLRPVNIHDVNEYELLRSQRKTAGWHFEATRLDSWRSAIDSGTKCLFWITASTTFPENNITTVGHISLDSEPEDSDVELAKPDKSLLTVRSLFVLPEHRGKGAAKAAMLQLEEFAAAEPYGSAACTALTLTSLSCKYVEDSIWRARYLGWVGEEPLSYERWYASLGYVKWKEEACTVGVGKDGNTFVLVEAFMKKSLGGAIA